tara:strand:+ start:1208 stop:2197 length:990 start_codon:yes stop_codon:yes gene_type:complete
MKKSDLASLVFIGLSSCNLVGNNDVLPTLENTVEKVFEKKDFLKEVDLEINNYHVLSYDDERMNALEKFYLNSISLEKQKENPAQNIVTIIAKSDEEDCLDFAGQGYMIDDCGLILTVYHVAKRISKKRIFSFVLDMDGNKYPISKTDFIYPLRDYALIVANTGKNPKTHALNFAEPLEYGFGEDVFFISSHLDYFRRGEDVPFPMQIVHRDGNIISSENILEKVIDGSKDYEINKVLLESSLNFQKNERGFFFVSNTVYPGQSGSPVFNNDFKFMGLVQGTYTKMDRTSWKYGVVEGVGCVSSSVLLLKDMKDFLEKEINEGKIVKSF